jgi:hypothetical protein
VTRWAFGQHVALLPSNRHCTIGIDTTQLFSSLLYLDFLLLSVSLLISVFTSLSWFIGMLVLILEEQ